MRADSQQICGTIFFFFSIFLSYFCITQTFWSVLECRQQEKKSSGFPFIKLMNLTRRDADAHEFILNFACFSFCEGGGTGYMLEPRCTIQGKLWLCFSDALVWCCVQTMFAFSHHCSAWWSRPISLLFFSRKGSSRGDGGHKALALVKKKKKKPCRQRMELMWWKVDSKQV